MAKSLVPLNFIGHGKVPYQKPWLKSTYILVQCMVPTQRERSIAECTLCVASLYIHTLHASYMKYLTNILHSYDNGAVGYN